LLINWVKYVFKLYFYNDEFWFLFCKIKSFVFIFIVFFFQSLKRKIMIFLYFII
jgi:hypothetical protein